MAAAVEFSHAAMTAPEWSQMLAAEAVCCEKAGAPGQQSEANGHNEKDGG